MVMNEVVDGGDILAHYLCPSEAADDPGTLFTKAIAGGTKLYGRFLRHPSQGGQFVGIPQTRSFFNYRGFEWTVGQTLAVQRNIDQGLCRRFERAEEVIEYRRLGTEEAAARLSKTTSAGGSAMPSRAAILRTVGACARSLVTSRGSAFVLQTASEHRSQSTLPLSAPLLADQRS